MAFKKKARRLRLDTALGDDVLELVGFRAEEELSQLSCFQLEMISHNTAIAAEDIVGTNVTVTLELDSGGERFFNGYVHRFSALEENDKGVRNYRAEVVPWLWFLTQTTDCRIFQEMSVVDIISQVFGELGFADFTTSRIFGVNAKRQRNYCVQYRESDFAFVSRLMEEEGMFYFFEHGQGTHTLHLADSAAAYRDAEAKVHYPTSEQHTHHVVPHITSWEHTYQFRPGAWAHTDYNFKTPGQRLLATESTLMNFKNAKHFEIFDFPGEFRSREYGKDLARIRMQELEADHDLVSGSSTCKTFSPGLSFTIGRHRSKNEEGKAYAVQRIVHHATQTDYQTGSNDTTASYNNEFQCFSASMVFRPPRRTPRPSVPGCQTAVVTGPPGETIYTDENERVKVQFFWDRQGKNDENSSCWIRVSQQWAGEGWGMVHIPHVGQEVIVMFQDGDPDQPLIIGRLFNASQKVPIRLPLEKTKTIMRDQGGNQTIMEGAAGKQFICFSQRPAAARSASNDGVSWLNKFTAKQENTAMAKEVVVTEEAGELPTEGNRIIMDATAGKEKIQIIDQANNQIVMNAVAGSEYIKLSSPKHKTQVVLGDVKKAKSDDGEYAKYGIYMYTDADYKIHADNSYWKHIVGHSTTTCLGAYSTFVAGAYSTVVGGGYSTVVGLAKLDLFLAFKFEIGVGAKFKLQYQPEYKLFKGGKIAKYSPTAEEQITTLRSELTSLMDTKIAAKECSITAITKVNISAVTINLGCGALCVKSPPAPPPPPPAPPPPAPPG